MILSPEEHGCLDAEVVNLIKAKKVVEGVGSLSKKLKKNWPQWDSNPRPYGPAPEAGALDHSATLSLGANIKLYGLFEHIYHINQQLFS